jgi:hypothetical protein
MSFGFGFGLPSWQTLSGGFTPASLFSAGEQGAWYDPSDFSTLFTNSAGATPVTAVEQFVGLMLDKRNGPETWSNVGPELVVNGDFSSSAGWTQNTGSTNISISGGTFNLTNSGNDSGYFRSLSTQANAWYEISIVINSVTSGSIIAFLGDSSYPGTGSITAAGTYKRRIFTSTTNTKFYVTSGSAGTTAVVDSVSMKLITPVGNHAASTGTKRPKLAARYNLLQRTEEFDNGYWAKVNTTVTANAAVAPNGTTTAELAYPTTNGTDRIVWNGSNVVTIVNGLQYVSSIYAKASGKSIVWFGTLAGNTADANCAFFDLQNQTASAGAYFSSASITPVGNGWYLCKATATSVSTVGYGIYGSADAAGSTSVTANGTDGVLFWGADLRPASQATGLIGPTYQRVVDAATYDTAGFLPYLQFDGIDDSMSTGSIDFTATDKMTVWAGVRKLSDSTAIAFETSSDYNSNTGSFISVTGSNVAPTDRYSFASRGTGAVANTTASTSVGNAPDTAVITGTGNISGDLNTVRRNGVLGTNATADLGAGNFGNYPLFIGARNNASLYFNGWLTSLIVRGAQSTQSQIEATEAWVNQRTGAY